MENIINKKIELKSIETWNFKGEEHRLVDFGDNITKISGDNGLGKSRHFAAFCWCLFGKDQFDRKDYEILTRKNGEIVPKQNAEVEVLLSVNGAPIKLHRTLKQIWNKPRGKKDEIYKGCETECFINDVPTKVGEYNKKVDDILNNSLFKLLSNPYYFSEILEWKAQRDILFQIAGEITDNEIAGNNKDFIKLLQDMNGKSQEDFSKEVGAHLKDLKEMPKELQTRIEQTKKLFPEAKDFRAIEKEIETIEANIRELTLRKDGIISQDDEHKQKIQELSAEITSLKAKQSHAQYVAAQEEQNKCDEQNIERNKLINEQKTLEAEYSSYKQRYDLRSGIKADLDKAIAEYNAKREAFLNEWKQEHDQQFEGGTCVFCGQPLPEDKLEEALKKFNDAKANVLAKIQEKGKKNTDELRKAEEALKSCENDIANMESGMKDAETKITDIKAKIAAIPETSPRSINPAEIKECVELQAQIDAKRQEIEAPYQGADTSEIMEELRMANELRDQLKKDLYDEKRIEFLEKETKELQDKLDATNNEIAEWEQKEYLMKQFARAKADILQERINGIFTMVRFQLFGFTIEGNAFETCVPMPLTSEGFVPFGTANRAAQINAGLDIINALTRFYGTTAPIFIDNAEAVNKPLQTEGQQIHLVVSEDSELKYNYTF